MAKMMNGSTTTIWWVTDVTYDPDNPSAALLTTARNISCAVETGYKLGAMKSNEDKSSSICDNSNVSNLTFSKYEGQLTFFRDSDVTDTTSDFSKAFTFFRSGIQAGLVTGYLVIRYGYASTAAAAATQVVSSYKFIPDNPQDADDGTAPVRMVVDFRPQGKMSQFKALVA